MINVNCHYIVASLHILHLHSYITVNRQTVRSLNKPHSLQVETIGDCYMVAGGLVKKDADGFKAVMSNGVDPLHAVRVMDFAKVRVRIMTS